MVLIVDKNLVLRQFAQRHLANRQFTNKLIILDKRDSWSITQLAKATDHQICWA